MKDPIRTTDLQDWITLTPKMRVAWSGQYLTLLSAPVFLQRKAFQTFMTQLGG